MMIKLTSRVGVFTLLIFLSSTLTFAQQPATAKKTCLSGNCIDGKGKAVYPNGDTYEGDFVNNIPDGFGTFTEINGNVYAGQMSKSEFQGKGKFFWKSGSVYEGDFVKNKREGEGKTTSADGSYFAGIYKGDWRDGFGIEFDKSTNLLRKGIWNGSTLVKSSSVSSTVGGNSISQRQDNSSGISGGTLSGLKESAVDANIAAKKAVIGSVMNNAINMQTNKQRLKPARELLRLQKELVQYLSEAVNSNELSENAKQKYSPIIRAEKETVKQYENLVRITEEAANQGL